jgi:hypothetical protein
VRALTTPRRVAAGVVSELEDKLCPDLIMNVSERAELMTLLQKLNAELGSAFDFCRVTEALSVGYKLDLAREHIQSALQDFCPDEVEPLAVEFPRRKF